MKKYILPALFVVCITIFYSPDLFAEVTVADSTQDFSSNQGDSGWSYGSGFGAGFDTDGWKYVADPVHWICDRRPGGGVGFLGNYPLPNDALTSYTQVFPLSTDSVTRAWKSDRNLPEANISVRFYFVSEGSEGVILRIYRNDEELKTIHIENNVAPWTWRDIVSLKADIKAGDTIYFALSSESNKSDHDDNVFRATITSPK